MRGWGLGEGVRRIQSSEFRMQNGGKQAGARSKRMEWWAGAASAIAACLAVLVTAQYVMRPANVGGGGATVVKDAGPVVDQVTFTRDVDGGTVVLDGQTPARVVRQQTVRKTEWFDPKEKATYQVTEPIEKVDYVPVRPY